MPAIVTKIKTNVRIERPHCVHVLRTHTSVKT